MPLLSPPQDIEKLAMKKGVVLQSIKEVLQSLVDDDFVHQDKIGISNFFWAFRGESGARLETELSRANKSLQHATAQKKAFEAEIVSSSAAQKDSEERSELAAQMSALEERQASLKRELAAYSDCDPETLAALIRGAEVAKLAANRWMDNIWSFESWAKRQMQGREVDLRKFFEESGITDKLDYVGMDVTMPKMPTMAASSSAATTAATLIVTPLSTYNKANKGSMMGGRQPSSKVAKRS